MRNKVYLAKMFDSVPLYTCKEETAAFTGHRLIAPPTQQGLFIAAAQSAEDYIRQVESRLDTAIGKLTEDGYGTFLCGMAAGFDLMAGLAVCKRIEAGEPLDLIALIPHPGQAYKFSPEDKAVYNRILAAASEAHTVCPQYRTDCFHRRNDLLVDNSSALVCYYDGSPGGTHYTVKKGLKNGLKIINTYQ